MPTRKLSAGVGDRSSIPPMFDTKLKNLFAAHQDAYRKLIRDNLNESQKTKLKESLATYQKQIKSLVVQRKAAKDLDRKRFDLRDSSCFLIKKKDEKPCSFVIRKKSTVQFYIRKQDACSTEFGSNFKHREPCLSSVNLDEIFKDNNISSVPTITKEEDSMPNSVETQSDHSIESEKKPFVCDGHGKTSDDKKDFILHLGLVAKTEYQEMATQKKSRKRRTTANPQFSSAAIEAKRINKMEMANERRIRRQLALEKQNKKVVAAPVENKVEIPKKSSSPELIDCVCDEEFFKSRNVFSAENEQFPDLFLLPADLRIRAHCKTCSEPCQPAKDTVLVCQKCLSLFHMNCLEHRVFLWDYGIQCPVCKKPSAQMEIQIPIARLQQHVESMSVVQCLKKLLEKKQLKMEKLRKDTEEVQDKVNRVERLLCALRDDNDIQEDSSDKSSNEFNSSDANPASENQDDSDNAARQSLSSLDHYEPETAAIDSYVGGRSTNNVDNNKQEFSILSSCA